MKHGINAQDTEESNELVLVFSWGLSGGLGSIFGGTIRTNLKKIHVKL